MSRVNCYDTLSVILDKATKKFEESGLTLDELRRDTLKSYCEAIDSIIDEFDAESLEVEVNERNAEVEITIELSDMVIEDSKHIIYQLFERAIKFEFSSVNDSLFSVKFIFPEHMDTIGEKYE